MSRANELLTYTIGHSTRTLTEVISLLKSYGVNVLVDVRSVPRSRHNPQFNKEALPETLKSASIKYLHVPELGGLRRPRPDSANLALENKSFRGYADYMQTKEFSENLLRLMALIGENCLAIMCAEAVPWRCHRILLSDALVARHVTVKHILTENSGITHELTPSAHVEGTKVTYPLFAKEKTQRTLTDFGAVAT
ncbi:MAG: DUF488 domain-containing protein [Candidatus Bathyarchaeota archaeon]|nr:DUF488 domain-containing protein [Candidatus Bathyarchaeota archaeon]